MESFDFSRIMLMAKEGNKEGLAALPQNYLVEFIVILYKRYELAKDAICPSEQMIGVVEKLSRKLICDAETGTFTSRMHEMGQQLAEVEEERDKLRVANEDLEDRLQCIQERVDGLEKALAEVPKLGRPERYDADFRARVKAYYKEGGHTYRDTARYFNISTNTVGRFLKE